ncbi:hypothetical protein C8J56DRAFT_1037499 [Mycena floridula]|nr:hypothetical protein C8J56DRAFT_1037499 [Mycena floridula]
MPTGTCQAWSLPVLVAYCCNRINALGSLVLSLAIALSSDFGSCRLCMASTKFLISSFRAGGLFLTWCLHFIQNYTFIDAIFTIRRRIALLCWCMALLDDSLTLSFV